RRHLRGATSIIGWPLDDALDRGKPPGSASSFTAVSRLLSLINSGGSADDMENVLATDPTLAFRLFRYLNSPAFGLTVEIRSFEHAMMMLGQKRMKKWLSLLLATASPDPNLNTLMFASVRRGFLMEKLVSEFHEKQVQDEAFIIGVFSMLDKLFCEPFEKLFERLQISDSVYEALVSGTGPSMPYLNLATALEHSPDQISEAQDNAFITPSSCNTMLLSTLTEAAQAQQAT
ncbi:MAG: HDOD domain-containing protein, partial [Burkholderiaceae bacterium]